MNTKATILSVALTAGALLSGLVWYGHVAQNNTVSPRDSSPTGKLSEPSALDALSPGATPPPVPWAGSANAKNGIIQESKENSVLVTPSPPSELLRGTVSGNDNTPINQRRISNGPVDAIRQAPAQVGTYQAISPESAVQTGRPVVQYVPVERPRTYVRRVVLVRKHTGKVHFGRAVKHVVGFSLKLPFKLVP